MNFLCIDPGASGAAVLSEGCMVGAVCPWTGYTTAVRCATAAACNKSIAVIEQVHGSPIMGPGNAFSFGENFGVWIGALLTLGVKTYAVTPQAWQKVVCPDVTSKGDDRKRDLRDLAKRIFSPSTFRITLDNCDALLLSNYALHQHAAGKALGKLVE